MGKKNRKSNNFDKESQDVETQDDETQDVETQVEEIQDNNNLEIKKDLYEVVSLKQENDNLKQENDSLKQENNSLKQELKTVIIELEEHKLRIEGLTKLELLLKIKENLKNKNVELVNEQNKLEETLKEDKSTEKIVVETKVEIKKPPHKKLNPFFRRY
jgi:hypothetical protein